MDGTGPRYAALSFCNAATAARTRLRRTASMSQGRKTCLQGDEMMTDDQQPMHGPGTPPQLAVPSDLGGNATRDIAAAMNKLLADSFALYLKTKNFH